MTMQKENPAEAYPLYWPMGRKRTVYRERAKFGLPFARARDELVKNLRLLSARAVVLSTNIPLRRDGLPLAGTAQPKDPGAAVYFTYKGKPMCFACDRWQKVEDNIRAIALTIEALRGIARWGTGDMLEAAFAGFQALPAPDTEKTWREVLGVAAACSDWDQIHNAYLSARSRTHPDKGGDDGMFVQVLTAYEMAKQEFKR